MLSVTVRSMLRINIKRETRALLNEDGTLQEEIKYILNWIEKASWNKENRNWSWSKRICSKKNSWTSKQKDRPGKIPKKNLNYIINTFINLIKEKMGGRSRCC